MKPESESFKIPQATPSSEDTDSFKLKYEQRRALVKTPDEKLIELGKKESHGFKNPTEQISASDFFAGAAVLDEHLKGERLIDLGSGENGLNRGLTFTRPEGYERGHDFGISEFVAVDLFADQSVVMNNIEFSLKKLDSDVREMAEKRLRFEKEDILTYLLEQADGSGNIRISSIDQALIPSSEYFARVAQEIFRVVPENGVLSIINCPEINDEAKKLFPYSVKFERGSEVLSKKEVCPQIVADTGTFDVYRYFLEGSRKGFLEMNEEIVASVGEAERGIHTYIQNDRAKKDRDYRPSFENHLGFDEVIQEYLEKCGFRIETEEFWKAWDVGSGKVSISRE